MNNTTQTIFLYPASEEQSIAQKLLILCQKKPLALKIQAQTP